MAHSFEVQPTIKIICSCVLWCVCMTFVYSIWCLSKLSGTHPGLPATLPAALMTSLMWFAFSAPSALSPSSLVRLRVAITLAALLSFWLSPALTTFPLLHLFHLCLICRPPSPLLSSLSPPFIWLPPLFFSLQGNTIESEHLSELTEEEYEAHIYQRQDLKGFMWLDAKYLNPFFTRRLTQEVSERQKSSEWPGRQQNSARDLLLLFHCFPVS